MSGTDGSRQLPRCDSAIAAGGHARSSPVPASYGATLSIYTCVLLSWSYEKLVGWPPYSPTPPPPPPHTHTQTHTLPYPASCPAGCPTFPGYILNTKGDHYGDDIGCVKGIQAQVALDACDSNIACLAFSLNYQPAWNQTCWKTASNIKTRPGTPGPWCFYVKSGKRTCCPPCSG